MRELLKVLGGICLGVGAYILAFDLRQQYIPAGWILLVSGALIVGAVFDGGKNE